MGELRDGGERLSSTYVATLLAYSSSDSRNASKYVEYTMKRTVTPRRKDALSFSYGSVTSHDSTITFSDGESEVLH